MYWTDGKNVEYVHYELYSPVCCLEYKRAKQLQHNLLPYNKCTSMTELCVLSYSTVCHPQTHTLHVWVATVELVLDGMTAKWGPDGNRDIPSEVWVLERSSFPEGTCKVQSSWWEVREAIAGAVSPSGLQYLLPKNKLTFFVSS